MAEIPVERKSGVPWWVWLLLAALVIGGLVWIFADNDAEPAGTTAIVPAATTAVVDPVTPSVGTAEASANGPITDLAILTGTANLAPMIGRQVSLSAVPVTAMAGDRTFFVGEGPNRLFVMLPELRPGLPSEESVNVNAGQTVTLSGTLQAAQQSVAGEPVEGLPADTEAMLVANRVDIISR